MRDVHDHQPIQWPALLGGKAPSDHRPPIMPNQHNALGVCGVNQRHHVVQKMRQSVVCDLCRPGGAPVSALINGPDAIAHSREHWYLVPPRDCVLRKSMQAKRQPVSDTLFSTSKRSPLALTNLVCK